MRIGAIPIDVVRVRDATTHWWRSRVGGGRVQAIFWSLVIVILAIPIVAIVLLGLALIVALALATLIVGALRGLFVGAMPTLRRDGRENVRVIRRE